MTLTFVQGDTAPDVSSKLAYEDGSPVNLRDASVKFQMRRPDDRRFTVNADADVTDALLGGVSYSWSTNDLAVPGDYVIQWEITFQDLRIQTTAETESIRIRRQ